MLSDLGFKFRISIIQLLLLLLEALIVAHKFKLAFPYFSPSGFFSGCLMFFCLFYYYESHKIPAIHLVLHIKQRIPKIALGLQFLNSGICQTFPFEISNIRVYLPNGEDKMLPVFSLKLLI